MADSDCEFEVRERFPPNLDDMQGTYTQNDMLDDDTNVLNLNDEHQSASTIDDNETADETRLGDNDEKQNEEEVEVRSIITSFIYSLIL